MSVDISIQQDGDDLIVQQLKSELEMLIQIEERDLYESSLSSFIKAAWPVIEPGTPFMSNWHIDLIAEHLEAVRRGDIKRLIINIPPRHMKSISATVMFPVWCWTRNPEMRFLFASYAHSLSVKHSVDRRTIIESDWHRRLWGHLYSLRGDQNVKQEFQNTKRGVMVATSVGGTATGKGGDIIIVDDPHNPKQAHSEVERQHAIDFFNQTLSTRLDNPKTGRIVVIMQRLHEDDLTGHLLKRGDGWHHLCIPGESETKTRYVFPSSNRTITRKVGDLLWPERVGRKELDTLKISLGGYGYAGQVMQSPAPSEGGMIKRRWLVDNMYDKMPVQFDEVFQSWDCTFKDGDGTDYVVGQVWGRRKCHAYLLDQVRDRMDFPSTIAAIKAMKAAWPTTGSILVEDKANGPAVISTLRNEITGVTPINPEGGKVDRVNAASPILESGCVHIPAAAAFTQDFVTECCMFPNGKHDDQVDAMTQALIKKILRRSGILSWYQEMAEELEQQRKQAARDGKQVEQLNGAVAIHGSHSAADFIEALTPEASHE